MLASSLSSVVFPHPLRPTIPKNSPSATSKETSRSASRCLYSTRRRGCSARSFTVSTRWVGTRNRFCRSRTSIAFRRCPITLIRPLGHGQEGCHAAHHRLVQGRVPIGAPVDCRSSNPALEVPDADHCLPEPGQHPLEGWVHREE